MRLDQWLVARGKAPSRAKAKELIQCGAIQVKFKGEPIEVIRPSLEVFDGEGFEVEVIDESRIKYVSRGGLKLEGALRYLNLDVSNFRCLDLGQSTGGFSDCLIRFGASQVIGIDVGHEQLHKSLMNHPRIQSYEGFHISQLVGDLSQELAAKNFDLVVGDLSFISTDAYVTTLCDYMVREQKLLLLIKPQFEMGPDARDKRGRIRELNVHELKMMIISRFNLCFDCIDFFKSDLLGQDGNQEYFLFATKK